jgi:hypothetical protein
MSELAKTGLLETAEAHHRKIKGQAKGSAADALAAGWALLQAKAATPGKRWLAALKSATSMNPRSVQRYMLLARAKDAGILGENVEAMSFSEAYRLAVRQAVRIARKSAPASSGTKPAAASEEHTKALKAFRQALRGAIAAGIPFRRLERELNERIGAQVLTRGSAAGESESEDQASDR